MSEYRKVFKSGNSLVTVIPEKFALPMAIGSRTMLKMDAIDTDKILIEVVREGKVIKYD